MIACWRSKEKNAAGGDEEMRLEKLTSDVRSDSYQNLDASNLNEEQRIYFISLFEKYDRDANGKMDVQELKEMIQKENTDVSDRIVRKLIKYSDKNNDGKIDVNEFIDMVLDRKYKQLFGRYVKNYVDFVVPQNKRHKFKPIGRRADLLGTSEPEGAYEDGMSCCPPPVCMILVSILEIICYFLNENLENRNSSSVVGPVADILIYDPGKRQESWRFLTYMFVHIGWLHITMNLICQTFLGLALELRNRWWRVLTVYMAGVVAGSLITSITDPTVFLAGASGGVYAILTAHLSNIIINWSEMSYPGVQLFIFVLLILSDISTAIHNRYFLKDQTPIGYSAHLGGAIAGFLVGIWVLKNVESTQKEKYLWWAAFIVYILLMVTGIVLNVAWKGHFLPTQ